jgi:hypothetical protein
MSLRKKGRQQLRQKISVHWTRKKLRQIHLYLPPSPTSCQTDPDSPPHSTYRRHRHKTHRRRRGGSLSQVSCVYAVSTYTSLSQSPTYLSPQHPNHNRRRRNPNLCRRRGSGPSTTFLPLRRRFGYTPPLSLYLVYISLPMLLFFSPNLTITGSAGLNSHLGHNIDGGNKRST